MDYVLKPFGRQRFDAAVTRALDRLRALDALTLQRTLMSMAQDRATVDQPPAEAAIAPGDPPTSAPRRLAVRNGAKLTLVDVQSIDWVESDGDYARIRAGKTSHLVAQRMHALERLLEPLGFIRVHRSIIVNGSRIRELHRDADGGGTIVLREGVSPASGPRQVGRAVYRVARGRAVTLKTRRTGWQVGHRAVRFHDSTRSTHGWSTELWPEGQ